MADDARDVSRRLAKQHVGSLLIRTGSTRLFVHHRQPKLHWVRGKTQLGDGLLHGECRRISIALCHALLQLLLASLDLVPDLVHGVEAQGTECVVAGSFS
eukprot:6625135-Prymnesium_polylepis.1